MTIRRICRTLLGGLVTIALSAILASAAQQQKEKVVPSFDCHRTVYAADPRASR